MRYLGNDMESTFTTIIPSPLGPLGLSGTESHITALSFDSFDTVGVTTRVPEVLSVARGQVEEYFAGARRDFDFPLEQPGTDFQQRVWRELRAIPFGETISYGELAERIGNPAAVRAVGMANGRNNVVIVVPCHRVIGSDGSLTGYGGGFAAETMAAGARGVFFGAWAARSASASSGPF